MMRQAALVAGLAIVSVLVFVGFARVGEWIPAILAGLLAPVAVVCELVRLVAKGGDHASAGERLVVWFAIAMLGTMAALNIGGP